MPPPKWLVALICIWIAAVILGEYSEGYYFGTHGEVTALNTFMHMRVFSGGNPLFDFPATVFSTAFWSALAKIFSFEYVMFEGAIGSIIRYILVYALTIPLFLIIVFRIASMIRGSGG